jgi:uncharacterized membrane protein YeaQ/YmgE (transglycosylase-associated protein family)
MSLIAWILVGGIAGWLASVLTGKNDQTGCITSIIVGMVGSLIGGSLVVFLNGGGLDFTTAFNNFNLTSIVVSTMGAAIFLLILKAINK